MQELFNTDDYNLTSRQTKSNYKNGRFVLKVETDGNLLLWILNDETHGALQDNFYWQSHTDTNNSRLVFNNSTGSLSLVAPNGTRLLSLTSKEDKTDLTKEYYHRVSLDYDGVLRHYIHPQNITNATRSGSSWSLLSHTPADICNGRPMTFDRGICGFNTICRITNNETSQYSCHCVDGYSALDANDPSKGCERDVGVNYGCEIETRSGLFEFKTIKDVDWPKSDYDELESFDKQSCRRSCEDDCLCIAAVFYHPLNGCYKKSHPLANGRFNSNRTTTAFIRVWNSSMMNTSFVSTSWKTKYKSWAIGSSTALGASALLNFFFLLSICPVLSLLGKFKKKKKKRSKLVLKLDPNDMGFNSLHCFSYETLEDSTNGFTEQLGHGSFGTVYKGAIVVNSHQTEISIAVKKLDIDFVQMKKADKEFRTEVNVIGQTHHRNLVNLIGYCNQADNRILVYEFMSNGSLADLLFGIKKPSWSQRFQITLSVAKGLAYLHEECNNPIIHCDIKSQNVLLDDNLEPKISDFGLAKLMNKDQSKTNTDIRGTRGYAAPEWFRNGPVTAKLDVYSFGVMLLEIMYCRRCFEPNLEDQNAAVLVDWAYDCYLKGELLVSLGFGNDDQKVEEEEKEGAIHFDIEKIKMMMMIAVWCVQEDDLLRPSMGRVVLMLEGAVEVVPPPYPYLDSGITSIHDDQEIKDA